MIYPTETVFTGIIRNNDSSIIIYSKIKRSKYIFIQCYRFLTKQ